MTTIEDGEGAYLEAPETRSSENVLEGHFSSSEGEVGPGLEQDKSEEQVETPPELSEYVSAARLLEGVTGLHPVSLRSLYQVLRRADLAAWVPVPTTIPCELQIPQSYWASTSEEQFLERFHQPAAHAVAMPAADVMLGVSAALRQAKLYRKLTTKVPDHFQLRFDTTEKSDWFEAELSLDEWRSAKTVIRRAIRQDLFDRSAHYADRHYDLMFWGPDVFEAFGPAPSTPGARKAGGRPRKWPRETVHELLLKVFFADRNRIGADPAVLYEHMLQMAKSDGIVLPKWPTKKEFSDHLRKDLGRGKS
jgi:hypothetical protein